MSEHAIPEDYTPAPWLMGYGKRELQWLAQQLHDRNTRLQIDNQAMRQRLALYDAREKGTN
ncbi:hypothetical protein [Sinomonas gamaensis]|uniref:hypothetical protein n=1 Tax=Sinomonas gamaensis TaxID=2565624 RepID=UPI001109792E|nr:hypothetical protein [Sinomonas gamaensis]